MTNYLGVQAVKALGRRLGRLSPKPNQLQADEVLVFLLNNGLETIAPQISDSHELGAWLRTKAAGNYIHGEFIALKRSDVDKCPDQGAFKEFNQIAF